MGQRNQHQSRLGRGFAEIRKQVLASSDMYWLGRGILPTEAVQLQTERRIVA